MRISRRTLIQSISALTVLEGLRPLTVLGENQNLSWHVRATPMVASVIEIAVQLQDREAALQIIGDCFTYLDQAAAQLSNWSDNSAVSSFNRGTPWQLPALPSYLTTLVQRASQIHRSAGGYFELYGNALYDLWRKAKAARSLPSQAEIKLALKMIEHTHTTIDSDILTLQGSSGIDVGGIGQGLLADLAAAFLYSRGIQLARIDVSGDLRFLGHPAEPWKVLLEHPRKEQFLAEVQLKASQAISTSGDYRNNWSVNGRNYHHLINPQTGYPGTVNQQVTVVADNCCQADALASAFFFMTSSEASNYIKKFPGAAAIGVASSGEIWTASYSNKVLPKITLLSS